MTDNEKGFFKRTAVTLGFAAPEPTISERAVDGPAAGVIPPARDSITGISVEQALSIGAVYRCVSIISAAVSQMELGVYRNGVEIDTPTIIKQPNVNESQRQFIKQTVWSLSTHGNAYWRVYGDYPSIQNLEVLDPNSVTITTDRNGKKHYWVGPDEVRNVKHLRLMTKPGIDKGFGPIQHGTNELVAAIKTARYADKWFTGNVASIIKVRGATNGLQKEAILENLKKFLEGSSNTLVTDETTEYQAIDSNPATLQLLEVQQANTVAIARLFGVPATLLASGNEGTSNTYMNQQELFMQFLQTTLIDYMNEIEDALSSLLPRGQVVNFKEDALLRMNTQLETEVAIAQVSNGLITANEWRKAHGLDPIASAPAPQSELSGDDE